MNILIGRLSLFRRGGVVKDSGFVSSRFIVEPRRESKLDIRLNAACGSIDKALMPALQCRGNWVAGISALANENRIGMIGGGIAVRISFSDSAGDFGPKLVQFGAADSVTS